MGILAVDSIKSRTTGPVQVSDDLNVTGVSTVGVLTATSVVVGSAVTVNADGVITSGIVTATTFQGNVNGAVSQLHIQQQLESIPQRNECKVELDTICMVNHLNFML